MHIQAILAVSFAASTALAYKPNSPSNSRNLALAAFAAALAGAPALIQAGPITSRGTEPNLSEDADSELFAELYGDEAPSESNLGARGADAKKVLSSLNKAQRQKALDCNPDTGTHSWAKPLPPDYEWETDIGQLIWLPGCLPISDESLQELDDWIKNPERPEDFEKKCAWRYWEESYKFRADFCPNTYWDRAMDFLLVEASPPSTHSFYHDRFPFPAQTGHLDIRLGRTHVHTQRALQSRDD
jgi:hypothetical protein